MATRRVNLRIPEELCEELEALQEIKGLSRSEIIRRAIEDYIEKEAPSWNTEAIEIRLPNALVSEIEMLIRNRVVADIDQAGLLAFRDWCRTEEEHYAKGLPAAEESMKRYAERADTEMKMKRKAGDMRRL